MSESSIVYDQPPWASYLHMVLFVLLVAMSIPCCNLFYLGLYDYFECCPWRKYPNLVANMSQEMSPDNQPAPNTKNSSSIKNNFPWYLKVTLLISITFSYVYILLQSIFSTFRIGLHGILSDLFCKCFGGAVLGYIFVYSRLFLYLYFILRAYHAFQGTNLTYKKSTILIISVSVVIVFQSVAVPFLIYSLENKEIFVIRNDIGGDLCYVQSSENSSDLITPIFYGCAALFDVIVSIIGVYLLINNLFKLIKKFPDENDLALLATRLLCLLLCIVTSSQITVMTTVLTNALSNLNISTVLYSWDVVLNMYCLWLTFSVNEEYYYKYFGGRKCMKILFPIVKTMALTDHNFWCCCCTYWCVCDAEKKTKQTELRQSAKQEIELVLS